MFINVSRDMGRKKFQPKEIKCPNCTEPNLKLKWHRRNEQGRNEYWDLVTNALHLCKTKYLKNLKTCSRCNTPNLRFKKIQDKWTLFTTKGTLHECDFSFLYKPLNRYEIESIQKAKEYYDYYYRN